MRGRLAWKPLRHDDERGARTRFQECDRHIGHDAGGWSTTIP
jgi:hypothetical protein